MLLHGLQLALHSSALDTMQDYRRVGARTATSLELCHILKPYSLLARVSSHSSDFAPGTTRNFNNIGVLDATGPVLITTPWGNSPLFAHRG